MSSFREPLHINLSLPGWAQGLIIGLFLSLADAIITKAYAPHAIPPHALVNATEDYTDCLITLSAKWLRINLAGVQHRTDLRLGHTLGLRFWRVKPQNRFVKLIAFCA